MRFSLNFFRLIIVCVLFVAMVPSQSVRADINQNYSYSTLNFNSGEIISDEIFNNSDSMSVEEIQAFLVSQNSSSNSMAMPNYISNIPYVQANNLCTEIIAEDNKPASYIISKASLSCGINPQVLLVILEKEQSLVTSINPPLWKLKSAMGFACPDTAECDINYQNFFTQIYSSAKQLKNYQVNSDYFRYQAGKYNMIKYHPKEECKTEDVFISNKATAALYNYTPYVPNKAAIQAGGGLGDECSSYGNRNFYNYFSAWFGTTLVTKALGHLDNLTVTAPNVYVSKNIDKVKLLPSLPVLINGWLAFNELPNSSVSLSISVDGNVVVPKLLAANARPDISAVNPNIGANHGFETVLDLSYGKHTVCVTELISDQIVECRDIDVRRQVITLD